jgi:hypothetical protein
MRLPFLANSKPDSPITPAGCQRRISAIRILRSFWASPFALHSARPPRSARPSRGRRWPSSSLLAGLAGTVPACKTRPARSGTWSDALQRVTGVSIDSSGNVWLCNNWLQVPVQTNPGGDGLVVFIGLAAPVKMPLIGPPQQP